MTTTTTTTTIPIRIEALAFLAIALCMCGLSLFGTYATFLAGDPTVEVWPFSLALAAVSGIAALIAPRLGLLSRHRWLAPAAVGMLFVGALLVLGADELSAVSFMLGSSSRLGIVRDLRAVVRNGLEPIRLCPARHRRLRNVAWHRFQLLPSSFRRDGSLPRGRIMRHSRLHFSGNAATSYRCRCASNPTRA